MSTTDIFFFALSRMKSQLLAITSIYALPAEKDIIIPNHYIIPYFIFYLFHLLINTHHKITHKNFNYQFIPYIIIINKYHSIHYDLLYSHYIQFAKPFKWLQVCTDYAK